MEIQNKILEEISLKSKELIQNEIVPYINNLVDLKLGEEKEKFYDETNILGDIFPKRTDGFCGNCHLCNLNSEYYKQQNGGYSDRYKKWKEECSSICSLKISESCKLYDDEYIILCSRRYEGNSNRTYYYTNYGRLCFIQPKDFWIYTSDRGGSNHMMYGNDGQCGRARGVVSEYFDKKVLLTNEYIDILNTVDLILNNGSGQYFDFHLFNKLIHIYKKYNPKASEIYKIEKEKLEIKRMMEDLQKKEQFIVLENNKLEDKKIELGKEIQIIENDKIELETNKNIHKHKSKNLLKRENAVFTKETIKSVHEELTDISVTLLDLIDLIEEEPVINERLEQIIKKLGNIYKSDEVIIASEIC